MLTIGLIMTLALVLVVLGIISARSQPTRTVEVIEVSDDDTQALRKLINPRR